MALLLVVVQDGLQSASKVSLSYLDGSVARDAERLANLGVAPASGGFEKRVRSLKAARVGPTRMDEGL